MADSAPLGGYGPLDSDSVIRAAATLNATENSNENTFTTPGGVPLDQGYGVLVRFPTAPTGTSPTCVATVKSADAGELLSVAHIDTIDGATTYPFTLVLPLPPSRSENWELELVLGGTSPVYANVAAYVVRRVHAKVNA